MRKQGRAIMGLLLSVGLFAGCSDIASQYSGGSQKSQVPAAANLTSGANQYVGQCASCHGIDGSGIATLGNSLLACESCQGTFEQFVARIHATMPQGSPTDCGESDNCARDTAAYVLCSFNPDLVAGCPTATIPGTADLGQGMTLYDQQCGFCHIADGSGSPLGPPLQNCNNCQTTFEALEDLIRDTMPAVPFSPTGCVDSCAEDTAAYIFCSFNPGLADGCPAP